MASEIEIEHYAEVDHAENRPGYHPVLDSPDLLLFGQIPISLIVERPESRLSKRPHALPTISAVGEVLISALGAFHRGGAEDFDNKRMPYIAERSNI